MWEELLITVLLEASGFQLEKSFEDTLNEYFLEDPEDEFLLELEFISADLKKARSELVSKCLGNPQKYNCQNFPAAMCKKLEEIYDQVSLEEFVPRAYRLWQIIPGRSDAPFLNLGCIDKVPAEKDIPRAEALYRELFRYYPDGFDKEPQSGTIYEANVTMKEYMSVCQGSVQPDFEKAELLLGFPLHESTKDFYSRVFAPTIVGTVVLPEEGFTVPIGNKRFDKWFSFNEIKGKTGIRLLPCVSPKSSAGFIRDHFYIWTGGNDFGQRVYIGYLSTNIGGITIVINNRTGAVEWVDCGYGHYEKYEKNPHGILAENMEEFLHKLQVI